jgi:zinc/manganese transport system substrate-binding protein
VAGRQLGAIVLFTGLVATGCSDPAGSADGRPVVVATHSILGDLVANVVGDQATVEVLLPRGADPHDVEPSASQVADMTEADLIVANGLGLEHGLEDAIDAAADAGVTVLDLGEQVDPLPLEHGDELDPHWFTDPVRMASAADLVAAAVSAVPGVDAGRVADAAAAYIEELGVLDEDVATTLSVIPADARRLVTNHEVLGYFAERYGLDVVGTVIPSGSTLAEPSAADLGDLVDRIESSGIPALFVEASAPAGLVDVVAGEVGDDVAVVELWSESLGDEGSPASTYLGLLRADAARIAEALA